MLPIKGYQRLVSPMLPRSCKYHPSCSQYAVDAVRSFGVLRGSVLAVWRVLRCNPFSNGGYDPVKRQKVFHRHASNTFAGAVEDREAVAR